MRAIGTGKRIWKTVRLVLATMVILFAIFLLWKYLANQHLRKTILQERSVRSGIVEVLEINDSPLEIGVDTCRYKVCFRKGPGGNTDIRVDFWYNRQWISRALISDEFRVEKDSTYYLVPRHKWKKNGLYRLYRRLPHQMAGRMLLPFLFFSSPVDEGSGRMRYDLGQRTVWIDADKRVFEMGRGAFEMDIGTYVSTFAVVGRNYHIDLPDSVFAHNPGLLPRVEGQDGKPDPVPSRLASATEVGYLDIDRLAVEPFGRGYVLFDFWYSACYPCHKGLRKLDRNLEKLREMGIATYAVNPIDNREQIRYYLEKYGYRMDVLRISGEDKRFFGVQAYPTTILYDGTGRELYRHEGHDPDLIANLEQLVRRE